MERSPGGNNRLWGSSRASCRAHDQRPGIGGHFDKKKNLSTLSKTWNLTDSTTTLEEILQKKSLPAAEWLMQHFSTSWSKELVLS